MPKLTKGQAFVGTEEQVQNLITYLSKAPYAKRNVLLIMFSYYLGLRAVEIAALKVGDVYKDGKIVEAVQMTRTKGNKAGVFYLNNRFVIKALLSYLEERQYPAGDESLFISSRGLGFTNRSLQKHFEYIYKKYGYPGFSSHSGRRTIATKIYRETKDAKILQSFLRHKNIATTFRYIDNDPIAVQSITSNIGY